MRGATLTLVRAGRAGAAGEGRARAALPRRRSCRAARCASASPACSRSARCCPPCACAARVRPLAVLNGDAKTVVRLVLEDAEAVLERGRRVPLASRLTVEPVLGYDAELERTLRVLRDRLGFAPAERPLFDEAVLRRRRAARRASRPSRKVELAARHPHRRAPPRVVLRAPAGDRRDEPAGHDRRPRHRVPARPARLDPPRALGAARAQGRARPGAARAPARRAQVGAERSPARCATSTSSCSSGRSSSALLAPRARGRSSSRCASCSRAAARAS